MRVLPLLIAIAVAGTATARAAGGPDWATAEKKAGEQDKSAKGRAYNDGPMLQAHNSFWDDVGDACSQDALDAKLTKFDMIVVLDADGQVSNVLLKPDQPANACYRDEMMSKSYPPPPEAPFHLRFGVDLGKSAKGG